MAERRIRATWDALAASSAATPTVVGDPARGAAELEALFGRLGAEPRGGRCLEVGCGPGRMTGALSERFGSVLAVDVSPAMLERARAAVSADNVSFRVVSGERLDAVPDAFADVAVCYLVLQHLPSRRVVVSYLRELGRTLRPGGEAFVQLPVLDGGVRPRLWRLLRTVVVPLVERVSREPLHGAAFRGFRLTSGELERALAAAALDVAARDTGPDAPYRHSHDVFLRLVRRPAQA